MLREPVPTIDHEEESDSQEMGGFEAHSKQPVLSPTTKETTSSPLKTENKGKQRAEE